jgi:hypothetical protein
LPSLPFLALYLCTAIHERSQPSAKDIPTSKHSLFPSFLKVTLTRYGTVGIPKGHRAAPPTVEYLLHSTSLFQYREAPKSSPDSDQAQDNPLARNALDSDDMPTPRPEPKIDGESLPNLWPFQDVFASGTMETVAPIPQELAEGLDTRAFKDQPKRAVLIPIPLDSSNSPKPTIPYAVMITGLNTRQSYDADYARWLSSIASAFAGRLAVVMKMEMDMEMMRERTRLDKAKSMFFMTVSHGGSSVLSQTARF